MNIDLSAVTFRQPDEHPQLRNWPPFHRYLVAALERRGWTRLNAVALVREVSAEAGHSLSRSTAA